MSDLRLMEVLEVAEDMSIDVPHIWVYLAELIVPMLHEDGIPMGLLFRWVWQPCRACSLRCGHVFMC